MNRMSRYGFCLTPTSLAQQPQFHPYPELCSHLAPPVVMLASRTSPPRYPKLMWNLDTTKFSCISRGGVRKTTFRTSPSCSLSPAAAGKIRIGVADSNRGSLSRAPDTCLRVKIVRLRKKLVKKHLSASRRRALCPSIATRSWTAATWGTGFSWPTGDMARHTKVHSTKCICAKAASSAPSHTLDRNDAAESCSTIPLRS